MAREDALSKAIMTLIYFQVHFCKSKEAFDNTQAIIDTLEQIEQEPRWIPVSEKLPNLNDYTGTRVWQKKVLITGYLSYDDKKDLFVSEAFAEDVVHNSVYDTVVTAWMSLPKTYKAESEE